MTALKALGDFFGWLWESAIKPAWNALGDGIAWVWTNVVMPAFDALKAALGAVGDFFSWVWNSVVKPAWDALGAGIAWVWENVISPAWDALKQGLSNIKDSFKSAVDFIGQVWDGIKSIVAKPIKFVVETVYNNGIRAAWNKVAGWLNLPELPEANLGGLAGYSAGGYTGPGAKNAVAGVVHGDEFVVRKESRRRFEAANPGALDHLNKTGMLPGYAGGGVVASMTEIVQKKYPMLTMTSGLRSGDSGMHGQGLAADFSNGSGNTPAQLALAKDIAATYPGSAELIYDSPGWSGNIKNGKNVGAFGEFYTMDQAGNHQHHVHWGMTVPPTMDFGGGVFEGGSDGGSGGGIFATVKNFLRNKVAEAFDAIMTPIGNAIPDFGAGMGQVPKAMFTYMKDAVRGFITGKADEKDAASPSSNYVSGAGAEQWRQMMIDAYKNQGYEPTPQKIDAWVKQIDTESNGDPNVAQKIVDVNGTGEAAGVGLGQMIPTTWQAYRDPSLPDNRRDPWAMTNAMVRYGEQKYGAHLLDVIGQGHGYAGGGIIPGYTPGRDTTQVRVGGGEAIVRPEWTRAVGTNYVNGMNALARRGGVSSVREAMMQGFANGGVVDPNEYLRNRLSKYGSDVADIAKSAIPEILGISGTPLDLTNNRYIKAGQDVAQAFQSTRDQQSNTPNSQVTTTATPKGPLQVVEEHIHYHVADLQEAMSKERVRQQQKALTFS